MSDPILFEVITPERVALRENISSLVVPGSYGYLGIRAGHAPLVTDLVPGVVTFILAGKKEKMAVSGGFLEVSANKITLLADTAERHAEIDVARAKRAMERAERRLRRHKEGLSVMRAELAVRRALARIQAGTEAEK